MPRLDTWPQYRRSTRLEYPFSSQTPVIPATDTYPPVGDNGIDLCVRAEVCYLERRTSKLPSQFWQVLFDNLRRLVGMSASETRVLNEANGSRKSLFLWMIQLSTLI